MCSAGALAALLPTLCDLPSSICSLSALHRQSEDAYRSTCQTYRSLPLAPWNLFRYSLQVIVHGHPLETACCLHHHKLALLLRMDLLRLLSPEAHKPVMKDLRGNASL